MGPWCVVPRLCLGCGLEREQLGLIRRRGGEEQGRRVTLTSDTVSLHNEVPKASHQHREPSCHPR